MFKELQEANVPQATSKSTTVSSATQSDYIFLEPGEWALMATSTGWGSADLQVGDGSKFANAQDGPGKDVTFSEDKTVIVAGGMCYRLNVTSYSQPITLSAFRSKN